MTEFDFIISHHPLFSLQIDDIKVHFFISTYQERRKNNKRESRRKLVSKNLEDNLKSK